MTDAIGEFDTNRLADQPKPWAVVGEGIEATMGMLRDEHADGCDPGDECDCETDSFSWSSCEGCGSNLGGERHAYTIWWDNSMIEHLPEVFDAYLECALWSSTDDDGTPLDSEYATSDIADESSTAMHAEVGAFINLCESQRPGCLAALSPSQIGYDLWLTRNGHGAGFWDRGLGELGDFLTKQAKSYGSSDLYVGDDDRLHIQ